MLPKIKISTIELTIPSTKEKALFSRFVVRDEKILLTAKESGETSDILNSIRQVVNNSLQTPTIDLNRLTVADLEFLFLRIHAASVSNIVKLTLSDPDDGEKYSFDVDLNKVEVDSSKQIDPNIKISDNIMIHLNHVPAKLYGDKTLAESKDYIFDVICKCMDRVFEGDSVTDTKNLTQKEISEWISNLDYQSYQKLREFYLNAPTLNHTIKYTNKNNLERTYTLSSLSDFFSL